MRLLTLRRPWPWAVIFAGKDVENRQRNVAGSYRGPIAIHAGLQTDNSVDDHEHPMNGLIYPTCPNARDGDHNRYRCTWCTRIEPQRHAHAGHIIGVADLVDVHTDSVGDRPEVHCSPWAETHALHLVLDNRRPLLQPIPFRGVQGLRRLDAETIARVGAAIA